MSGNDHYFAAVALGFSPVSILFASFPGATSETLLQKFNSVHKDCPFYEIPQKKENAFIVRHYAGKVKYQVRQSG